MVILTTQIQVFIITILIIREHVINVKEAECVRVETVIMDNVFNAMVQDIAIMIMVSTLVAMPHMKRLNNVQNATDVDIAQHAVDLGNVKTAVDAEK